MRGQAQGRSDAAAVGHDEAAARAAHGDAAAEDGADPLEGLAPDRGLAEGGGGNAGQMAEEREDAGFRRELSQGGAK